MSFSSQIQDIIIEAYDMLGVHVERKSTFLTIGTGNSLLDKGLNALNSMVRAWYAEEICIWEDYTYINEFVPSTFIRSYPTNVPNRFSVDTRKYECINGYYSGTYKAPVGLTPNTPLSQAYPGYDESFPIWRSYWYETDTYSGALNPHHEDREYNSVATQRLPTVVGQGTPETGLTVDKDNDSSLYVLDVNKMHIKRSDKPDSWTSLTKISKEEFLGYPAIDPSNSGRPTHFYFETYDGTAVLNHRLNLYPYPDTDKYMMKVEIKGSSAATMVLDQNNLSKEVDFPVQYKEALVTNLAAKLAYNVGSDKDKIILLDRLAKQKKDDAVKASRYSTDVSFVINGFE